MADSNDTTHITALKARVAALGYQLYITAGGAQLVTGANRDGTKVEVVFVHESDVDDDLEGWIADREKEGTDDETALDRARHDAQMVTYETRDLVRAALKLNGDDDGRIEECLKAALTKLDKLANDLDSVNWPEAAKTPQAGERSASEPLSTETNLALFEIDAVLHTLLGLAMSPEGIENDRRPPAFE